LFALGENDGNPRIAGLQADPALGRTGYWIEPDLAVEATAKGFTVADPLSVMVSHFADIVRGEAARLLSRPVVIEMIDGVRQRQASLVEDLIPAMLSVAEVQRILRNLLAERVSIANLDLILENLVDLARDERNIDELTEQLRRRLGFAICSQLRGHHRDLAVMSLDPRLENELTGALTGAGRVMDPRIADGLLRGVAPLVERMFREGRAPVLLCGTEIRRAIKALTRRAAPRLSVISIDEIPERIDLSSYAVVKVDA
jgi:flagellar biosynthesis protein FlhA